MSDSLRRRIEALELAHAAGDSSTLAALLRGFFREGSMPAAVASLELRRPLAPEFVARAEVMAAKMRDTTDAMEAATLSPRDLQAQRSNATT